MQGAFWGARRLARAGVAAPRAEAEGLLAHVLSQPRHACYLEPDAPLTADDRAAAFAGRAAPTAFPLNT
jgi:hypothetical protein